jgi:hypothetical protein
MKKFLFSISQVILAPVLENGKFSLGRWTLTTCLILALWKWAHNVNIPESHMTAIIIFAGYVLGTKGIITVQEMVSTYKQIKSGKNNEQAKD